MTKKNLLLTSVATTLIFSGIASGLIVNTYAQNSSQNSSNSSANSTSKDSRKSMGMRFFNKKNKENSDSKNSEKREVINQALQNRNFEAWKTAITDTPRGEYLISKINQDNFGKYVDMLNLIKTSQEEDTIEENLTKIDQMRQELGLPTSSQRKVTRKAIKMAIKNKDYNAFKTALAGTPMEKQMLSKIDTQDKFNQMVEKTLQPKNNFLSDGLEDNLSGENNKFMMKEFL
jgi:hypothetical protein